MVPPLPAGELRALRAEVVGLLEVLAEEVRRVGRGQLAAPSSRRATTQHAPPPPAGRSHLTSMTFNNRFQ